MKSAARPPSPASMLHAQAVAHLRAGRLGDGITLLEQALALNPGGADLHNDMATALWQSGAPDKAATHYDKARKLGPNKPHILANYGLFLLESGRTEDAEKPLRKAVSLAPGHPEALNNLGLCLHRCGRLDEAEQTLIAAINAAPRWPNPHYNIGAVYKDKGWTERAMAAFSKTVDLFPGHAPAWLSLAQIAEAAGRQDEAIAHFRKTLSLAPTTEAAWESLARLYEARNALDEARDSIARGRKHFPDSIGLHLAHAKILRREGRADEALPALESALERLDKDSPANHAIYFELGQLYDARSDTDKAFAAFSKANALHASTPEARAIPTDTAPARIREYLDNLPAAKNWPAAPPLPEGTPAMVFLVGFPRSGTTLLDQILSGHPDIAVAEEEPGLAEVGKKLLTDHPERALAETLNGLTADDIAALRMQYFDTMTARGALPADCRVFIDKLPLNLIHAPLIHRLFPDARFLLALRHPCDCVLSNFMQLYALNNSMIHMLDLQSATRLYADAFAAWEDYVKELGLTVHEVRYENVVADLKSEIVKALEFLGLDWNNSVAAYEKTAQARKIKTPSYAQVTRGLYTAASGRWTRYRPHMASVLSLLAPAAARYGYTLKEESEPQTLSS